MLSLMVKSVAGTALMLAVPLASPAWSADKTALHKKHVCKSANHRHAKTVVLGKPARGVMIVEQRKDVQILSFGP